MKTITRSEYHAGLWKLTDQYEGESLSRPLLDVSTADCHDKFTREQVHLAAIVVSRFLGIDGSGRDFDLYRLLHAYVRDIDTRQEINQLLLAS